MEVAPLYGHTSPETAYEVDDYPYGFRLRCRIRYWLESDPRRGFRFVSQTTNPKRGDEWNKPKKSTYAALSGAMYLDSEGHVQWYGLTEYADANEVATFVRAYPDADLSALKPYVAVKVGYCTAVAAGKAVWKVNGVPQPPTEADISRAQEELAIWQSIVLPG